MEKRADVVNSAERIHATNTHDNYSHRNTCFTTRHLSSNPSLYETSHDAAHMQGAAGLRGRQMSPAVTSSTVPSSSVRTADMHNDYLSAHVSKQGGEATRENR